MKTLSSLSARVSLEHRFMLAIVVLLAAERTLSVVTLRSGGWLTSTVLFAVVGAVIWLLAHNLVFKPLHRLSVMAKAIGSGDFSKRLRFVQNDEVGSLALEMDSMCDQLQAAQLAAEAHIAALHQLRHSDRIATLGRLASSVAHELGNPLNVIELRAQLISAGDVPTMASAQQSAAVIVEQSRRMTRIIQEILSFARVQPARIARLDLVNTLRQAIALSEPTWKKHKTQVVLNTPAQRIEIEGDADKLLQVIVNLVMNGVQAMPEGGILDLSLCDERHAPPDDPDGAQRDYVCIAVADHGVGIAPELIPCLFEPFFSTKAGEGGTGLGLSVAQGIALEHAGWISVESKLGAGTSFKVHLPKHGKEPANAAPRAGSTSTA